MMVRSGKNIEEKKNLKIGGTAVENKEECSCALHSDVNELGDKITSSWKKKRERLLEGRRPRSATPVTASKSHKYRRRRAKSCGAGWGHHSISPISNSHDRKPSGKDTEEGCTGSSGWSHHDPVCRACCGQGDFDSEPGQWMVNLGVHSREHLRGKRSNSSLMKSVPEECESMFETERDLWKVKRSLRLLGFELSDFGVYSSGTETTPRQKTTPRRKPHTYTTRTLRRSISLVSLREAVKRAWMDNRLDNSFRRLLAQAAYEEWYFKKERELWRKREEEKMLKMIARENFQIASERKKEKAEEEFKKWMQKKRGKEKRKEKEKKIRVIKSKEEIEAAFLMWKKGKDKELENKRKEKKAEQAKKIESERLKMEKKMVAEKAFQQWKAKLEETQKAEEEKRSKRKKHQKGLGKSREKETQVSFLMWKAAKDEEAKQKITQLRKAHEERLAQMEDRMYLAEQAFQDWLEKVDMRRQKQFCNSHSFQNNIPWLPV